MLAPATVLEALEHTLAANLEALHERIRIPSIPTDTHGADGGMWRADHPSTMVSTRGMRKLAFSLRGAANTLHSGRHGSGLANPLHAIARLITSQHQPDGRVALEGMVVHPGNALSADTNSGVVSLWTLSRGAARASTRHRSRPGYLSRD